MKPASPIDLSERDYFLDLNRHDWPHKQLPILANSPRSVKGHQWQASRWLAEQSPHYIWREVHKEAKKGEKQIFFEAILRFPSAPLFGLQRKRDYQVRLTPKHLHTFRLLLAKPPSDRHIERLVLMFNGLNETDHMGLYYDLAGLLLQEPNTACILWPTPGHLTRYPLLGRYAEKPLDRFIGDPGELFRQYLRFMIEMQWLLSAVVPVSLYPVVPGVSLLASDYDPDNSRCDSLRLSKDIAGAWQTISDASKELLEEGRVLNHIRQPGDDVEQEDILQSIKTLRHLIGWHRRENALSELQEDEAIPSPALHLLGYSLGGYFAQSTFFTWPFAIASCTTLCSGGALQDIKLAKFAHEEEWKAVSHGLKYEIETGLLEGRLRKTKTEPPVQICGIPATYFSSYFRIFNEVFLQDSHGSYRSRVSEFAPRLLFVVGGNDPIITTKSVLEASPREGINMIEIANLSHFLAVEKDEEWRKFWLPTISQVIRSFTRHAESLLSQSYLHNLWNRDRTDLVSERGRNDAPLDGFRKWRFEPKSLDSGGFQVVLQSLVHTLEISSAYVFVLRNRIPTALLGPRLLHRRGTVPHYEDSRIRRYWLGLEHRRKLLEKHSEKLTLVIPGRLKEWFVKPAPTFSAKSEPVAWEIPSTESLQQIWDDFLSQWEGTGALYCFNPNPKLNPKESVAKLEQMVRKRTYTEGRHPILNCLPDVWIGLSAEVVTVELMGGDERDRDVIERRFIELITDLYEELATGDAKPLLRKVRMWLAEGKLQIIRVSAAELTPRFLGEQISDAETAVELLVHSALALGRSTRCKELGDFKRIWAPEEVISDVGVLTDRVAAD